MSYGQLILIPVPLGPTTLDVVLPPHVVELGRHLTHFVAENAKSARAFIKQLPPVLPLQEITIDELNEHTSRTELDRLLSPLLAGIDVGLISEAGCPAVADPGANLVELAHRHHITVLPLVGPSSILLALMGSGLSGQNFAFHGYLPAKTEQRRDKIKSLERDSRHERRTQIFIETPYRNRQMLADLVAHCLPTTRICIATDLTLPAQQIQTRSAADWQTAAPPALDRRPTVFLLQA